MTVHEDPCHMSAVLEPGVVTTVRNESHKAMHRIVLQLIEIISADDSEYSHKVCEREYSGVDARGKLSDAWFALAIVKSASEQVPLSTPHVDLFTVRYTLRMKCHFTYCPAALLS